MGGAILHNHHPRGTAGLIVSLMQPYLFPYLGYLQLIHASDVFVAFDTVAYSKNSWVNRNQILVNGEPNWLTLPVSHDSHTLPINARSYVLGPMNLRRALRRVEFAYRRAPQFNTVYALVEKILTYDNPNVAAFNANALVRIAKFINIETPIFSASQLERKSALRGQAQVIDICHQLGATTYINPIGGAALYDPEAFMENGIDLVFLKTVFPEYHQRKAPFIPSLSIIDVLMFNGVDRVRAMLKDCQLIRRPLAGVY